MTGGDVPHHTGFSYDDRLLPYDGRQAYDDTVSARFAQGNKEPDYGNDFLVNYLHMEAITPEDTNQDPNTPELDQWVN